VELRCTHPERREVLVRYRVGDVSDEVSYVYVLQRGPARAILGDDRGGEQCVAIVEVMVCEVREECVWESAGRIPLYQPAP
jgi:hypothetical protein